MYHHQLYREFIPVKIPWIFPGAPGNIQGNLQGRNVVVVDVEAQWNIYSPNFVPGAYYPTFAILAWRASHQCEGLVIKVQPSACCIQDGL